MIGDVIKKRRKELGFTQQTLADAIAVIVGDFTRQSFQKWECNDSAPSIESWDALYQILDIDSIIKFDTKSKDPDNSNTLSFITADEVKQRTPLSDPDFKIKYFNKLVEDRIKWMITNLSDVFEIQLPYSVYGDHFVDVEFVKDFGYIILSANNAERSWTIRLKPE